MDLQQAYYGMKLKRNPQGRQMSMHGKNVSFTVHGNRILDQDGNVFLLRGVSKSGFEYFYMDYNRYNNDMFDFDIHLMSQWRVNSVRIPLRDSHWITNENYRNLVRTFVTKILDHAMIVIIDLHMQGDSLALDPFMKRSQQAKLFWEQMATEFGNIPAIFFEIFNEPHDISPDIWWNGNQEYYGYKEILAVIRKKADNLCILGGLDWAYQWDFLNYQTMIAKDLRSFSNIALATHVYGYKGRPFQNGTQTDPIPIKTITPQGNTTGDCSIGITVPTVPKKKFGWDESFGFLHLTNHYPIVATEFGLDRPDNCLQGGWFNNEIVRYFRRHGMGYVAWAWLDERLDYPSLLTKEMEPTGRAVFAQEGPACGCVENNFYQGPGQLVYDDMQKSATGERLLVSHSTPTYRCPDKTVYWNQWPFVAGVSLTMLYTLFRQRRLCRRKTKVVIDPDFSMEEDPTLRSHHCNIRVRSCSSLPRLQEPL